MTDQIEGSSARPAPLPKELEDSSLSPLPATEGEEAGARERPLGDARAAEYGVAAEFSTDEHTYIRDYIALADQKAGAFFTVVAAMLAYLQVQGATRRFISDPRGWHGFEVLTLLAVVGLVAGAILSLLVVAPRLTARKDGVVFWGAVASFASGGDYAEQVIAMDQQKLVRAKLEHCYELAGICRRKYRTLNWAIWMGGVGLAAAVVYVALASAPVPTTAP